ncbi:MAG: prepilin-type N-terminal cleavage/methylation domain-containing protein [bacterium]
MCFRSDRLITSAPARGRRRLLAVLGRRPAAWRSTGCTVAADGAAAARPGGCRVGRASGFTLIEAIAAIVILAVALPPIFIAIADAQRRHSGPVLLERARWLAAEKLEDVIADWHSATRGYAYITSVNYPAEAVIAGFPGLSRSTSISETGPNLIAAGAGYKTVTVSVTFPDANGSTLSFELATVITDYTP